MTDRAPLSRPVNVGALPREGVVVEVTADAEERAAVAGHLGILGVTALRATLTVTPWGGGGARVAGPLEAEVVQACVVTLEPVEQSVRETVDLRFSPDVPEPAAADVAIDPEAEDPPDLLEGGQVDLGAVCVEFLALGLDPYPRRPGVAFDPGSVPGLSAPESPFAALRDWPGRRSHDG